MINYLIEKYFTLLKGIAYGNASSLSSMDFYEFEKPEQLKNLNHLDLQLHQMQSYQKLQ